MNNSALPNQPLKIPASEHNITDDMISPSALKVMSGLRQHGYKAYLVGGSVRDLLLGIQPKDFDVATNATPEQVEEVFQRRCRLIGRRFRLAHVRFGRETIEVATFRGNAEQQKSDDAHVDEAGRILRDNVYGSIDEDAARRDFTINGLYYCAEERTVYDFLNGLHDLDEGFVRFVGEPETRYKEDPVRMLRAIRFAVKLQFDIHPDTELPLHSLAPLLQDIPAARLFEEVVKLLHSGNGLECFEELRYFGLFQPMFPIVESTLGNDIRQFPLSFLRESLINTDKRVSSDKSVNPAFLFAVMLWQPMRNAAEELHEKGMPISPATQRAASETLQFQSDRVSIIKRHRFQIQDIWYLQSRLERRAPKAIQTILEHPRFRAAYDFLILRGMTGDADPAVGQWWSEIQRVDEETKQTMIAELAPIKRARSNQRRRRRNGPPKSNNASAKQS